MTSTSRLVAGCVGLVVTLAGTASAQDWHPFSRNVERVYLADVGGILKLDDVTTIRVARVSRRTPAGDYTHVVDEISFRCEADQVRLGQTTEFGAAGEQADQYDDGADWGPIRPDTLDAYVQPMACEGEMAAPPTWPSIKAFVDGGRGG